MCDDLVRPWLIVLSGPEVCRAIYGARFVLSQCFVLPEACVSDTCVLGVHAQSVGPHCWSRSDDPPDLYMQNDGLLAYHRADRPLFLRSLVAPGLQSCSPQLSRS